MARNDNRRSIYCGPPIQELLSLVGEDGFSQIINGAVERYLIIVREQRPQFTREEWTAICGTLLEEPIETANLLRFGPRGLAMAIQFPHKSKERVEESLGLYEKVQDLNMAGVFAVLHAAEIYRAHIAEGKEKALDLALQD